MAYLAASQYGLRPTSVRATVPDNDVARLMYYLNCVFTAIEYNDQDVRKYRNYQNWSLLSNAEQRMVLYYAKVLAPTEFDGKVFFHSEELCVDSSNKFYEFSEIRHQFLAVESIFIAGQTRHVKKIMTYKMAWMQRNYYEPVERLTYYFEQQRQQAALARAATARSTRSTYTYENPTSDACVIS